MTGELALDAASMHAFAVEELHTTIKGVVLKVVSDEMKVRNKLRDGFHPKTGHDELSKQPYRRCAPGAVEGGDGIPVLFRVLEELDNIVSGDNTNGNIAGSNHFGRRMNYFSRTILWGIQGRNAVLGWLWL